MQIKKTILLIAALASLVACNSNNAKQGSMSSKPASTSIIDDDVIKADCPVVAVTGGNIQGYYSDDNELRIYKGIPYAICERFKAPVDAHWEGVKNCKEFGDSCIQNKIDDTPGGVYTSEFMGSIKSYSEDCLNINVWTKNDDVPNKPVILYIHGGANLAGNGSCKVYEGTGVARKDVVFVNINYRLGMFGWYSSDELIAEDPHAAGNYGLLDQIKALEWVRDNIHVFNGDKDNVMIVGQSAGAGGVNNLVISPRAKGLFKRAMPMSHNSTTSSNFKFLTTQEKADAFKSWIKEKVPNAPTKLEDLRKLSANDFYSTFKSIWTPQSSYGHVYGPNIDGEVLTGYYVDIVASGQANDVDYIIGACRNDSRVDIEGIDDLEESHSGQSCLGAYSHSVGKYQGKTWVYLFAHVMPGKSTSMGVFHTSDVPYFLNVLTHKRDKYWTEEDRKLADTMCTYLTNFAKSGNPNGEGLVEWKNTDSTVGNINWDYMRLDVECEFKTLSVSSQNAIKNHYSELIVRIDEKAAL